MEDGKIYFQKKGFEEFHFLSNFHESPFFADSAQWATVEHYYQAQKCVDREEKWAVWRAKTPAEAKKLGGRMRLRTDWEQVKDQVMLEAVREKFGQNAELRDQLLLTAGFELVEYAPWGDTYWGVDKDFNGQNKLGKALMVVRAELLKRRR